MSGIASGFVHRKVPGKYTLDAVRLARALEGLNPIAQQNLYDLLRRAVYGFPKAISAEELLQCWAEMRGEPDPAEGGTP